jgi:hypothetical protein
MPVGQQVSPLGQTPPPESSEHCCHATTTTDDHSVPTRSSTRPNRPLLLNMCRVMVHSRMQNKDQWRYYVKGRCRSKRPAPSKRSLRVMHGRFHRAFIKHTNGKYEPTNSPSNKRLRSSVTNCRSRETKKYDSMRRTPFLHCKCKCYFINHFLVGISYSYTPSGIS